MSSGGFPSNPLDNGRRFGKSRRSMGTTRATSLRPLTRAAGRLALALAVGLLAACEEEKQEAPKETDAGSAKDPALDPNLAKVLPVASAGRQPGMPGQPGQAADGPPPTGVFAAGQADKEAKKGSKPAVKIGSEGGTPKVRIPAPIPKPGKRKATLRLGLRTGPRTALPTIDFALTLDTAKPKAAAEGAPPADLSVTARIDQAKLAPTQPGAIPEQLQTQIAKLKGSKIQYSVAPNGGGYGFTHQLSKGADPGLEQAMRSLEEAIAVMSIPVPDKPMGAEGFWMATSRDAYSGADVVTYRMCRVAAITGANVTVKVSTKRYAASNTIDLAGVAPGQALEIVELRVQGEGSVDLAPDQGFPTKGELTDTLAIGLKPAGQPASPQQQRMGLSAEARTLFTLVVATP